MSFIDDIQGQNTQLYPIVTIEPPEESTDWFATLGKCILLSTNNVSLDHIHSIYHTNISPSNLIYSENIHFKPLLLNIPSIKESIDIESRKFKISNVSLDISNIEYEGERFTDILSDTSLINWKCSIQFVSPSANKFSTIFGLSNDTYSGWAGHSMYEAWSGTQQHSFSGLEQDAEGNTLYHSKMTQMVYQGIIRRISHDDTKAKIELEDLTEKLAHKDLPEVPPPSDYLPEKYRNQPIPMCYGHVERSPLLPYYSYSDDIGDDSDDVESLLEYRLKVDSRPYKEMVVETVPIGSAEFIKSALYVEENGSYFNIHRTNEELSDEAGSGIENFRYEDTSIVLDTSGAYYSISDDFVVTELTNDFSKGLLRVHQLRRFNKIDFIDEYDDFISSSNLTAETNFTPAANGFGRIEGTIDLKYQVSTAGSQMSPDMSRGYLKCILEPMRSPFSVAKDNEGLERKPTTLLLINIEHWHFGSEAGTPVGQSENNNAGSSAQHATRWAVWLGAGGTFGVGGGGTFDAYGVDGSTYSSIANIDNITGSHDFDLIDLSSGFGSLSTTDAISIGIPYHYFYRVEGGVTIIDDSHDLTWKVDTTINDAFVVQTFFLDGITDKDYYANVKGRMNIYDDHPVLNEDVFIESPIDIIYDLVRSELGHDAIDKVEYAEAKAQHKLADGTDWKFGFTINKKINSKKLIEEIAKSTKCFPKFKNDGTFGFNTIKDTYSFEGIDNDYDKAKVIKDSEVISYTFKKTKPEQIYKRVDVQYNKDYNEDSLSDRTTPIHTGTTTVDDMGNEIWEDKYYGIENAKDNYLEFESDYIRDENTANALAKFFSEQYKNDHLLFNLKLPLQYINLEVGGLVKFDALLGGVKPYGISYTMGESYNGQFRYPLFMITSATKNLDSVSIECMQLHHLEGVVVISTDSVGYSGADIEIRGTAVKASSGSLHIYVDDPDDFDYGDIVPNTYYLISGVTNLANENLTLGATNIVKVYHSYNPSYLWVDNWLGDGENQFRIYGARELDNDGDGLADTVATEGDDWDIEDSQDVTITLSEYTAPVSQTYGTGDVNGDDEVSILDVVQIINYILGNLAFSQSQINSADMNNDTGLNILDIVQIVNIILP